MHLHIRMYVHYFMQIRTHSEYRLIIWQTNKLHGSTGCSLVLGNCGRLKGLADKAVAN